MIKINENISADFFYSGSSFPGVMIASTERLISAEDNFVKEAEEKAKEFQPYEDIQTIRKYRKSGELKPRVNITLLMKFEGKGKDYSQKCTSVVWFDESEISAEESLKNILDEVDWDKARDFDF